MKVTSDGIDEITVTLSLDEASEISADPIFTGEDAFAISARFAESLSDVVSDLEADDDNEEIEGLDEDEDDELDIADPDDED